MKMKSKTTPPKANRLLVPEVPTQAPPTQTSEVPRDLTFEKPPGTLLKENGVLFMDKEFNQESCMPLVKQIIEYNLMPENKQPDVIKLYINSPGGLVMYAMQLIDTIRSSRIPVHTYNMGMAASCGCLLLMSGHKRFATHHSQTMSHVYSAGSGGKEHDLMSRVNSFKMTSKYMVDHYKKCTGKPESYIRKYLLPPEDVWLSAKEALKHGIIDEIVNVE